eukprot:794795-Pyramimonas_sp.AAC.2
MDDGKFTLDDGKFTLAWLRWSGSFPTLSSWGPCGGPHRSNHIYRRAPEGTPAAMGEIAGLSTGMPCVF